MIQLCILSDSHGFIHPDIVALVNQSDIAIHAGDIIDESTLNQLKPKQKLVAIQGNNDAHITQLNEVALLEFDSGKIVIEHGHQHGYQSPSHASLRATYPDAKIIIYGHTHKQVIDKTTTPWVINPGASGNTRNHGGAKCLTITINNAAKWEITPHQFN
ncbi:phosphodiesterase, MJ0936 family [uncultured Candidatus Thioglobus sp.]|nr:phosphodiesterase, MJ0936 family [uncultured Candidatus Thioglobus sp.]